MGLAGEPVGEMLRTIGVDARYRQFSTDRIPRSIREGRILGGIAVRPETEPGSEIIYPAP